MHKIYTVDVETSLLLPDRSEVILSGKEHYKAKSNERLDNLVQVKGEYILFVVY